MVEITVTIKDGEQKVIGENMNDTSFTLNYYKKDGDSRSSIQFLSDCTMDANEVKRKTQEAFDNFTSDFNELKDFRDWRGSDDR